MLAGTVHYNILVICHEQFVRLMENGWREIVDLAEYKIQEGMKLTDIELRLYQMYHNGFGCSSCAVTRREK